MDIIKDFFVICENAILDDKNKISLINLFDNLIVRGLPGAYPRMVFVGSFVITKDQDTPKYLNYELRIKKPSGNYIAIKIDSGKTVIDIQKSFGRKTGLIVTLNNILLEEYGMYTAELYIEGNVAATQTFEVIKDLSD